MGKKIEIEVELSSGGGGGGGTKIHQNLSGRDIPDQHPISAITDLTETLEGKGDNLRYEDNFLYLTSNGEDISEGIYITGGGGETPELYLTTSMPSNQVYSKQDEVNILCNFATTGRTKRANVSYIINGNTRASQRLTAEGDFSQNITEFLNEGSNIVEVRLVDAYNQTDSLFFNVTILVLSITSTFDSSVIYDGNVTFIYTPTGDISKTIHFDVDGVETTEIVTTSGRQQTKVFNLQPGVHSIRVWASATISTSTVNSNELYYEVIISGYEGTLISSEFRITSALQGEIINIPYMVYNFSTLTCSLEVYIDEQLVSELNVDRSRHTWSRAINEAGDHEIKFVSNDAERIFSIFIEEVHIDIEPVTENLDLFLTAAGRSNSDIDREVWHYNDIYCQLNNFNFITNGWINNALKISNGASVYIPFEIFNKDFRSKGKTIEIEFSTSNVLNYDTTTIDCMDNRGIKVTAQNAILKSEQSQVSTKFKEDEKIRIAFVVENRNANRLIYTYLNGIISGLTQYPDDDDFHQINPVGITIGSNECDIDIYNIRIYDSYLTHYDVLNNYIADTANVLEKLRLFTRNNIYDDYNNIVYSKLLNQVPIMTITGELPPTKGNKKKVRVKYENSADFTRDFEMNDVTIDIQGTSSQYYPKKNYKISKLPKEYSLRPESIAEKVFTMKADYMESSHAHNTGLAKMVNQMYQDKTPPQTTNPLVRTAIDGFPIAIFYKQNDLDVAKYFGVYNFNNDKESNNNWGFISGCESWEWCNNTSDRCLFKSDDFSDILEVLTDFEARYPSDYTNVTKLHNLVSWIVSCDSTKATDEELRSPVTYEGITYEYDTAEYRVAKFKDECEDHFNLNFLLTYYIFSEFFGMVDSRCKNMFMNYYIQDNRWYPVFYDLDTAIGLNNEGVNDFGFDIEYHDRIGTEFVFNGESSVLWNMVEKAYSTELTDLYNSLRNTNKLSYETAMNYLQVEQIDKICEAQYNEDAQFKYISPLIEEGTATYLYTAQGSRIDHIKWWVANRFKYLDSKYIASDYKNNYMTLRLYTPQVWSEVQPDAKITLNTYIDQYCKILYGSYLVGEKAKHNVPVTIVPPDITFNDTETIIYGADKILSVGDLAPLYAGTVDVSKAVKLSHLKVGHGGTYSNTNLRNLSLGNNVMLQDIDVRNCPNLSGALDISGCTNLLQLKATGTSLTSVKFAEAGSVTDLELPDTITNLSIKNQNNIETFICGYDNVNTLVLENCNLDSKQIFEDCINLTKVRITGIDWNLGSSFELLDRAYNMLGLDEAGYNLDHGVLAGIIRMTNVRESVVQEYERKFIGITFIIDEYAAEDFIYTDYEEVITDNFGNPFLYTINDSPST